MVSSDDRRAGVTVFRTRWSLWEALKTFSFRNLVFALILGVLAAGGGVAIALREPHLYSSEAVLIIEQPKQESDAQNEGILHKLALLKLKYRDLANTPDIAGPAAADLGMSESEVASATQAVATGQDLLLHTIAKTSNQGDGPKIADAVARSIALYADQEQTRIGVPAIDRYRFRLVKNASAAAQVQPRRSRALQAGAGLGVVALGLAYALLQLLTASVRLT